jgi:hypothetical protein
MGAGRKTYSQSYNGTNAGAFHIVSNVKDQPCVCLARIVPDRREEKARFVTSIRIGCIALLGSFFISFKSPWNDDLLGELSSEYSVCLLVLLFDEKASWHANDLKERPIITQHYHLPATRSETPTSLSDELFRCPVRPGQDRGDACCVNLANKFRIRVTRIV